MSRKRVIKIIGISFLAVILRAIFQTIIPAGHQSIFQPSIFVKKGILPIAFIIYGTIVYVVISYIFVLVQRGMGGSPTSKGIKFGGLCALMWAIYLCEPLSYVSTIDQIAYPLADGIVLIILGILLGKFVATSTFIPRKGLTARSIPNIMIIALVFTIARIFEYKLFKSYSRFEGTQVSTLIWVFATGGIVGFIFECLSSAIESRNNLIKAIKFGVVVFGMDLLFFSFFLVIIYEMNITNVLDLILRTFNDIASITIGCYLAITIENKFLLEWKNGNN